VKFPVSLVSKTPIPVRVPSEEELFLFSTEEGGHSLVRGHEIMCPGCESWADVLAYTPLQISSKYAAWVIAPLKCPDCGHVFAINPVPEVGHDGTR